MSAFVFLFILGLLLWFWRDSMQAHEQAVAAGNAACKRMNAQFLDQTVVLSKLRLCRTGRGNMSLCRRYVFDFTVDGENRREGVVKMIGQQIIDLVLDLDSSNVLH